jgi:FkbM family methyltransferase
MVFVSYAQNFEDVMLWRALRHVEHGFWVDVGAADPDVLSVTRAFSERGWHGINIEPAERPFRLLQQSRVNDINLQVAAGDTLGEVRLFVVDDANGLTTTDATIAAAHAKNGYRITPVTVSVTTLAEICAEHITGPVHFLKIDVEGGEKAVIAGADFVRFRPWIVLVEATAPGSEIQMHAAWEHLLLEAGYSFAYFDGLNRFYLAEEHVAELLPHFQSPPNVFDEFVRAGDMTAEARAAAAEARAAAAEVRTAAAEAAYASAAAHGAYADSEIEATKRHAAGLEVRANAAEDRVAALTSSTSWRLTRPMRSIVYRSRRLLGYPSPSPMQSIVYRCRRLLLHPRLGLLLRIAYRTRRLLRHPRLSRPLRIARRVRALLRRAARHLSSPSAPLQMPEWEMSSFRTLEDEAVMAVRAHAALTAQACRGHAFKLRA